MSSTGAGYGKATSLPAGPTPSTSVTGRNVTVSWAKVTLPNGSDVSGYRVRRYNASTGAEATISSSCNVMIATLTCTESAVAPGSWRYGVAPVQGNWVGPEGTRSPAVTVSGPAMSFTSSTNLTSLPGTLSGNLAGFVSGASVTFRLDNATTGTVLTGSTNPSAFGASGAATFSVTIPQGTSNGSHTVYTVANNGESASATIGVNVEAPTPTDLVTTNTGGSGGLGRPAQGDVVEVTYSQRLDVASMCSTWTGDTTSQFINGDLSVGVTISNNAAPSGNDQLTLPVAASVCGGTFNFGTIDLGSNAFVTANSTFAGSGASRTTVSWDPTTRVLSIKLGALYSGAAPVKVSSSVTAKYTPSAALRNSSWVPITGTASKTAVHF